jgi:hypothetical protein
LCGRESPTKARDSERSNGRALDPRFYCSLRAVKVVSPAFARRSPPLTVLARMRRVSIGSRRRVVAGGGEQAHGFFVNEMSRRVCAICAFIFSSSSFGMRRPFARSIMWSRRIFPFPPRRRAATVFFIMARYEFPINGILRGVRIGHDLERDCVMSIGPQVVADEFHGRTARTRRHRIPRSAASPLGRATGAAVNELGTPGPFRHSGRFTAVSLFCLQQNEW